MPLLQHSEAPWKIVIPGTRLGNAPAGGPFLIETVPGIEIARVRTEPDAILIARAPQLLAMCETLLRSSAADLKALEDLLTMTPGELRWLRR